MAHYFTMQFNLQTAASGYLKQAQAEAAMTRAFPQTVTALRQTVFEVLRNSGQAGLPEARVHELAVEKTLDEYLAEQEAHIIRQTLKRCGGNKSQAARILGIRANTLFYKLSRLGLLDDKE